MNRVRSSGGQRHFKVCLFSLVVSANNFAMKAKRKTLNAGDVLAAMEEMEFERFLEPLREALEGEDVSELHDPTHVQPLPLS